MAESTGIFFSQTPAMNPQLRPMIIRDGWGWSKIPGDTGDGAGAPVDA